LLGCQLNLAKVVCSLSGFSKSLHKRLTVLQRIYTAVSTKHHSKYYLTSSTNQKSPRNKVNCRQDDKDETAASVAVQGNDALLELGIKTGLTLLFSLLKQNWMLAGQLKQFSFCNEILQTAISVVTTFPPLSLANETKLTTLGIESLNQINKFLRLACSPQSGADLEGQRLAAELMIALASQRGSLCYVLEWVDMAMHTSVTVLTQDSNSQAGKINWNFFCDTVTQMIRSVVSVFT